MFSKKITAALVFVLMIGALAFAGCQAQKPLQNIEEEPLKVVTSIIPLFSLTSNLLEGTNAEIINLVPPNASEHTFQLTPSALKAIAEADLIVINGLELEHFLEDAFENTKGLVVDTSKGVELLTHREPLGEEDEDEHGEFDPHIWLDPARATTQVANIASALAEKDPANAVIYQQNREKLALDLQNLEAEIKEAFAKLEIAPYIVFHDAYQYFENAFGLKSAAAFEAFPGQEPSAQYLKALIDTIKAENVKAIFTEPQFSPRVMQNLAKDYGLTLAELDNLGTKVEKDEYFNMMRANVKSFEKTFMKKTDE